MRAGARYPSNSSNATLEGMDREETPEPQQRPRNAQNSRRPSAMDAVGADGDTHRLRDTATYGRRGGGAARRGSGARGMLTAAPSCAPRARFGTFGRLHARVRGSNILRHTGQRGARTREMAPPCAPSRDAAAPRRDAPPQHAPPSSQQQRAPVRGLQRAALPRPGALAGAERRPRAFRAGGGRRGCGPARPRGSAACRRGPPGPAG
jgi:hypothetical protein